ncbi:MAG: sialate O-acetylesterase [Bacteroidales bacterium]|jgi:sialate O-acetylesterase|nr:sialate O-acetylesterase [Bacteroidales bacterium]MCI2121670.1 sialate O-acetylesterase [Bacteroidales bacterium]MCI2144635.1 sialate O-acetylesterase [Bacteroidales bacterium]
MKKFVLFIFELLTCCISYAGIGLSSVFGDGMVLQQSTAVRIWGYSTPGSIVSIKASWGGNAEAKSDSTGLWAALVETPKAGYVPQSLTVTDNVNEAEVVKDILIGEVWMCSGQSNMELIMQPYPEKRLHVDNAESEIASAGNDYVRYLIVNRNESFRPVVEDKTSGWKKIDPESVRWVSAVGYYFASALQKMLDVPVGIICDYYGGSPIQSWLPGSCVEDTFYSEERGRLEEKEGSGAGRPDYDMIGALYNGMVYPVAGYTIKGWLWYQGESNVGEDVRYVRMMQDLVSSWRSLWKANLPFIFVQIPPFVYPGSQNEKWSLLAESQEEASKVIGNSEMIVIADIGDPANIHPGNKKTVGKRLANMVLNKCYGRTGIRCEYPQCVSARHHGKKAMLTFGNAGKGLHSNGKCGEFALSSNGTDYVKADIEIKGNRIILSAGNLPDPQYVRYCWHDSSRSDIFNSYNLPLGPFRTKLK